jgi:hypothetical protein
MVRFNLNFFKNTNSQLGAESKRLVIGEPTLISPPWFEGKSTSTFKKQQEQAASLRTPKPFSAQTSEDSFSSTNDSSKSTTKVTVPSRNLASLFGRIAQRFQTVRRPGAPIVPAYYTEANSGATDISPPRRRPSLERRHNAVVLLSMFNKGSDAAGQRPPSYDKSPSPQGSSIYSQTVEGPTQAASRPVSSLDGTAYTGTSSVSSLEGNTTTPDGSPFPYALDLKSPSPTESVATTIFSPFAYAADLATPVTPTYATFGDVYFKMNYVPKQGLRELTKRTDLGTVGDKNNAIGLGLLLPDTVYDPSQEAVVNQRESAEPAIDLPFLPSTVYDPSQEAVVNQRKPAEPAVDLQTLPSTVYDPSQEAVVNQRKSAEPAVDLRTLPFTVDVPSQKAATIASESPGPVSRAGLGRRDGGGTSSRVTADVSISVKPNKPMPERLLRTTYAAGATGAAIQQVAWAAMSFALGTPVTDFRSTMFGPNEGNSALSAFIPLPQINVSLPLLKEFSDGLSPTARMFLEGE